MSLRIAEGCIRLRGKKLALAGSAGRPLAACPRGSLRVEVHSRHLWGAGDAHELAVVEPVELALLATADDDIAAAKVDVGRSTV